MRPKELSSDNDVDEDMEKQVEDEQVERIRERIHTEKRIQEQETIVVNSTKVKPQSMAHERQTAKPTHTMSVRLSACLLHSVGNVWLSVDDSECLAKIIMDLLRCMIMQVKTSRTSQNLLTILSRKELMNCVLSLLTYSCMQLTPTANNHYFISVVFARYFCHIYTVLMSWHFHHVSILIVSLSHCSSIFAAGRI